MTAPMSLREGLAVGGVAAVLWSALVLARVAVTTSVGVVEAFPLLLCTCLMLVPPLVALGSRARLGSDRVARAALLATLVASSPLAVLGVLVHDRTHHRPLGAATLAIASVAVIAAATLAVRRLLAGPFGATSESTPRPPVRRALAGAAGLSLLATLAIAVRVGGEAVVWALVDVSLGGVAIGLCVRFRERLQRLASIGLPTWVAASVVAVILIRQNSEAASTVRAAAPVPLVVVVIDR